MDILLGPLRLQQFGEEAGIKTPEQMVELRTRFEQAAREQNASKLKALTSEINESRRNGSAPARASQMVRRNKQRVTTMEAKALLENHATPGAIQACC